jgi:TetR/AcrR family transcriptional regulator
MALTEIEEKILKAAKEVFIAKGWDGARVQEIAEAAGVNKTLIFYYFRSKEKIFSIVIEDIIGDLFDSVSRISKDSENFKNFLMKLIEGYIELINKYHGIINFLFWELKRNPEIIKIIKSKMSTNFYKLLEEKMEEAQRRGEIKKVDPLNFFINFMSLSGYIFINLDIFIITFNLTDEQTKKKFLSGRKAEIFRLLWNDIKLEQ